MKKQTLTLVAGASLFATVTSASITVWTETFDGTTIQQGVGSYTFGFDGDGTAAFDPNTADGNNVKQLDSEEWGIAGSPTSPGAWGIVDKGAVDPDGAGPLEAPGNSMQPNGGFGTMKGAGTFLDSSLFTQGTGVYTLTFQVVADSVPNNRNARVWVGTSSTHDQTATNGWGLDVSDVNLGTPVSPWFTSGSTNVATTVTDNFDTSVNSIITLDFNYTAGEDVGIVIGMANLDSAIASMSISVPEPSAYALLAGMAALGWVMIRRRG